MAWWAATSVTATNGSANVVINTGDPISGLFAGNALVIGNFAPVEIKQVYYTGSVNIIELIYPWPNATQTAQPARSFTTDADLNSIAKSLSTYLSTFTKASQTDAVTGTDNVNVMTALRTKEAIQALVGTAAYLTATANRVDHTTGRAFKMGDLGIGATLDLRTLYSNYDTPQKCYNKGTVFGFIDGAALGIPNYSSNAYGVLTIYGQYTDATGERGICQEFKYGAEVWLRAYASATTWTSWTKLLKFGENGFGTNIVGIKDVMAAWAPTTVLSNVNSTGSDCHYQGMIQNHGSFAPEAWGTISGFVSSGNNYSYTWQEFIGYTSTKWRRTAYGPGGWNEWRKVLEKNDFGIGGTGGAYTRCDNANVLTGTGMYWTAASWDGSPNPSPDGANQGYLIHQDWGTDNSYAIQRFFSVNGSVTSLFRRKDSNVWSRWHQEGEFAGAKGNTRSRPTMDYSTNVNLNSLTQAGWYNLLANPTNSSNFPPQPTNSTGWWYINNIVYNQGAQIQQYAYSYMSCDANGNPTDSYIFVRTYYNVSNTWSKWQMIAAPQVGTVYFDTPTQRSVGAIIERGSNANGEYTKFADGTAIAWGRVIDTGLSIQPSRTGNTNTAYPCNPTFPISFAVYPNVTIGQRAFYDASNEIVYSVLGAGGNGYPIMMSLGSRPVGAWPRLDEFGFAVATKVDYFWTATGRWR